MRLATWNVRTMRTGLPDTCGGSGCAQDLRKTAVINGELMRLNIAVSALQETRLPDEGSLREENYTFFWKGKDFSANREHGVGFAVRNDLLSSIETPQGISERIMTLRISSKCGFVTLISAYAPTLLATDEAKDQFYNHLAQIVDKVCPTDHLYILGDFNARVGQDITAWPDCLGVHGIGKLNNNGQRLLEFCSSNLLCVTNTYFRGRPSHKVSWKHPRSGYWHQLDLILTRKSALKETLHTRAFQSADCDTDHSLVVARVALTFRKIHSSKPLGRKKLNLFLAKDTDKVKSYSQLLRNETASWNVDAPLEEDWARIKKLLTDTACDTFGYHNIKSHDWFTENYDLLQPLLDAKRRATLNHRINSSSTSREELGKAKAALQCCSRVLANAHWNDLCHGIQLCAEKGDFSGMYSGIKQIIGPEPKKPALLKDANGNIITDHHHQLQRWVDHYSGLYSQAIDILPEAIDAISKLDIWNDLDNPPTIEEFRTAVDQVKSKKSPGGDCIYPEIAKLKCVSPMLYNFLRKCWEAGTVPQDMRDANIITLYKGKGDRGDCNNYRGISLLSIVGKLFGRVVLNKLQCLADRVYPESQCGFRPNRSTTDMIFSLRQLQEKCREQNTPLYIAFVDLNKAFDTVSRKGLYTCLELIGCPPKLLSIIKSFHEDMKGTIVFDGHMSDSFAVRHGVRQGCVLAPTLFGIFFSLLLNTAFDHNQPGVHLHTRSDGSLYNISLLRSKRHREDLFINNLLYADDAAFVANSPQELQALINQFARACTLFSMTINAKKTVVFAQGCVEPPVILLGDTLLEAVEKFCYLGSTVSNNLSLDVEIDIRIGKAATMFGRLRTRVWNNKHLTAKTKILVYQTCILSILLYGAETWTSYAKHERRLSSFHMRSLRSILGFSWSDRVTNERVLEIAGLPSFGAILKQKRLKWLGHVHRMEPTRLPRQVLLGAVAHSKRAIGRPLLRFKDCAKRDMITFNIDPNIWDGLAGDRSEWRKSLKDGQKRHDETWFETLASKRTKRHNCDQNPPAISHTCSRCGRACRSRIGLHSHIKKCFP